MKNSKNKATHNPKSGTGCYVKVLENNAKLQYRNNTDSGYSFGKTNNCLRQWVLCYLS